MKKIYSKGTDESEIDYANDDKLANEFYIR